MLGILLGTILPILYLLMATQWSRYVSRTTRADNDDKWIQAILIGAFWPVAIPFYIALHESTQEHYYREIERQDEEARLRRMTYRALTGKDE